MTCTLLHKPFLPKAASRQKASAIISAYYSEQAWERPHCHCCGCATTQQQQSFKILKTQLHNRTNLNPANMNMLVTRTTASCAGSAWQFPISFGRHQIYLIDWTTFMMTLEMMKNETKQDEKNHVIPSCLVAKQDTCHQRDKMRLRIQKKNQTPERWCATSRAWKKQSLYCRIHIRSSIGTNY